MSGGSLDRLSRTLLDKVGDLEIPRAIQEVFGHWRDDLPGFAESVLGVREIPGYQRAVMEDISKYERVAWVAGHAVGKSHLAAIVIAWYLLTRPGCRCIITSATYQRQVGRVVFAKLGTLVNAAPESLPLDVFSTRAEVAGNPEWSVEGVPAAKPANFSGFHSNRMLVIADEAKALEPAVFEELQGVLASARDEAKLILLSTAGAAQGYFYDAFGKPEIYRLHRTPSTESPFAKGFSERMLQDCLGPTDPVFRMRVLAEFAEDIEGSLIPISATQAAVGREFEDPEADEAAPPYLGCDIARFGEDRSVIVVRKGRRVVAIRSWRGANLMDTAQRIASEINARKPRKAFVDEAGVGGGVVDKLIELGFGALVVPVNVGRGSSRPNTFANLKAELGWGIRGVFERGEISLPPDDARLASELACLRYEYDTAQRIKMESKETAKKRLGRSPDLADALILAFSEEVSARDALPDNIDLASVNADLISSGGGHIPGLSDRWDDADVGTPLTTDYWI